MSNEDNSASTVDKSGVNCSSSDDISSQGFGRSFTESVEATDSSCAGFVLNLDCRDAVELTYNELRNIISSDKTNEDGNTDGVLEQQWEENDINAEEIMRKSLPEYEQNRSHISGRARMYRCEECGKMVDYYKQDRHARTHSGVKPHECGACGKRFSRTDILHIHERLHTGERPYSCSECGEKFARSDMLRSHQRMHTGDFFQCAYCCKSFTRAERLRSHVRVHTGEKLYGCTECERRFARVDNLRTHMKTHSGVEPSTNEEEFTNHVDEDSHNTPSETPPTTPAPYVCCQCNREFRLACRLRAHLRVHSGEKDFTCAVCGRQFALAYRLMLHMRTHTGERPHHCLICDKSFARMHNLKQHLRTHSGVRPYACEVCGKSYTQTKTLREHLRVHTGERPFECSVCFKKFARIDNLKVHELTHSDSKRHVCPTCGKKYADSRCFQKHVASHSLSSVGGVVVLPFQCRTCGEGFSDLRTLRSHSRTHHGRNVLPPTDQTYFCGQCGREMTVQLSTRAEIVLSANCACSGDMDDSVDGVIDETELDGVAVLSDSAADIDIKLEPNSGETDMANVDASSDYSNLFASDVA